MNKYSVSIGVEYTDQISGFTGTCSTKQDGIGGFCMVELTSENLDRDGRPVTAWFVPERLIPTETPAPATDTATPAPAQGQTGAIGDPGGIAAGGIADTKDSAPAN